MTMFELLLLTTTLLCSLVAGFVYAFAVVIMPGIRKLDDRDYLQAFKVMDRVIQDNQPLFVIVWAGSILAIIATAVMSLWHLQGIHQTLVMIAAALYILGVQVPTFTFNVPLNNRLKNIDLHTANEQTLQELTQAFSARWLPSNTFRTIIAIATTVLLLAAVGL